MVTLNDPNVNPVSRDDQSTDVAIEEQDSTGQTTDSNAPESPPNRRMLDIALHFLALGFAVFPVHTSRNGVCSCGRDCGRDNGKHPMTEHGHLDATRDRNQVIEWWTRWPDANIGIATGPDSGVFVVDLDIKDGVDGLATLQRLEEENGSLPPTLKSSTGSGGRHVILRMPSDGTIIRNSQGRIGPGIDVRGEGGYIIGVGSTHQSGECYGWVEGFSPEDGVEIAEAPQWLVDLATRTPPAAAAAPGVPVTELEDDEAQDIVDSLSNVWMLDRHHHHDSSMALAHIMARAGIPPDDIPNIIHAAACNAGDQDEIGRRDHWRAAHHALNREQGYGWPYLRDQAPHIYEAMRSCAAIHRSVPVCILEDLDDNVDVPVVSREEAAIAIREALDTATFELITGVSTSSGSGKTTAALNFALDRQSQGRKTGIVVPNHELLWALVSRLEGCTIVLAVTSRDQDGDYICTRSEEARQLASSGWNAHKVLCPECPERGDCVAKIGKVGIPGSEIIVGTHQMIREVARLVGPDGVIIIDESPEIWRGQILTMRELRAAMGSVGDILRRSNRHRNIIIQALSNLVAWASTHAPGIGNASTLEEILGSSELLLYGLTMYQLMPNTVVRDFASHAANLGKVISVVLAADGNPDMRFEVNEGEGGGLVVYGPHTRMTEAITNITVPVVFLDANLDDDEIRRVTGKEVRTVRLSLPDSAPVSRTVVIYNSGSRRYMISNGRSMWRNIVGPIRDALRRAEEVGARSILLGTYKAVAEDIQDLVYGNAVPINNAARTIRDLLLNWMNRDGDNPRELFIRHYGNVKGLNEFSDVDMTVSIGDPWINKLDAQRKALWLGVDFETMYRRYTRNEESQFHGRGRAVQRSTPLTSVHYGLVVPAFWTRGSEEGDNDIADGDVVINRLSPPGRPRVLTPEVVNSIHSLHEEGLTGQQIADRLDISVRSVRTALSRAGANITI